jgi:hypothetical protein
LPWASYSTLTTGTGETGGGGRVWADASVELVARAAVMRACWRCCMVIGPNFVARGSGRLGFFGAGGQSRSGIRVGAWLGGVAGAGAGELHIIRAGQ